MTDHSGTRIVHYYHHDEVEHLVRVLLPATTQFPSGIETRYDYDMDADHPAMRHNIVRITDASGRIYLENEYAGPEAGWAFNTVQRQLHGGFEYLFDYEQIQWVPPDEVFVEDLASRTCVGQPDGSLHVYTFNFRGDMLDHRTRLNADGSYRIIVIQQRHDAHGNLIETIEPDGASTVFTYDSTNPDARARSNLLKVERRAALPGTPSRIVLRAQFDPVYQLPISTFDEDGRETRLIYDFDLGVPNATGRLVRKESPATTLLDGTPQQSILHFEHDTRGRLVANISSRGARTELERFTGGLLDGFVSRVVADVAGAAETTQYEYDAFGFLRSTTAPDGGIFELRHNAVGQREALALPAIDGFSPVQTAWFGDAGAPVRVERPRGDYSDATITDAFIVDTFEFDVLGRMVVATQAANTARPRRLARKLDYDGRPLSEWNALKTRTDRVYDERGLLIEETRGVGTSSKSRTRYRYDRAGRVVRIEDAVGRVMTIAHDAWGRRREIHLPGGAIQHYIWGTCDRLQETFVEGTPGLGAPTRLLTRQTMTYDERGRTTAVTRWVFEDDATLAHPLTTQFSHDEDDNPIDVHLPTGAVISTQFDGLGRRVRSTDPDGNINRMSYDSGGRLGAVEISEVEGPVTRQRVHRYEYDIRGRLRVSQSPTSRTELTYDDRDLVREQHESGGVTTTFEVGAHGEILSTARDPGGLNVRSRWTYDAELQPIEYVDPVGQTTRWERDPLGRTTRTTLGDGSSWLRNFDPADRLLEQVTPSGSRTRYTYGNQFSSPTGFSVSAGAGLDAVPTHTYEYDALERLVRASAPTGNVARRYDSLGRVIEEATAAGTVSREFDDAARTFDIVYPDGRTERTTRDLLGRTVGVTLQTPGTLGGAAGTQLIAIDYLGIASAGRITYGNGVRATHAYDDARRVMRVDLRSAGGALLDSQRLRHDARGRRAVVQSAFPAPHASLAEFDNCDRLRATREDFPLDLLSNQPNPALQISDVATVATAAATATLVQSFDLNSADDRLQLTRSGAVSSVTTYQHASGHRLANVDGVSLTHHVDGHRASDDRFAYDVDGLGRLTRVRDVATNTVRAEYHYDALGRVAAGTLDGIVFTRAFVDQTWIEERSAGVVRQRSLHPLSIIPLSVTDALGTTYLHEDSGKSLWCSTNAAGNVEQRFRFDAFGSATVFAADGVTITAPASGREPIWRGMPTIANLGLYSTAQRAYDPATGVFLSRDPLLYNDSPSPYAYAAHNPVDFMDPTGREKQPVRGPELIETPKELLENDRWSKIMTYDLDPDKTGYQGEDYLGYGFIYGLKATIYKPIKSWLLDERPKYIDQQGNLRTTSFRPDRSAELAIAFGQIVQMLLPTPRTPPTSRLPVQAEATMGGGAGKLTFLENDIEVGYGSNYTRIGNDPHTMRVTEARQPWPNTHDIIVHAEAPAQGVGQRLSPGYVTNERPFWNVMETHEAQIADAVRWNPNLKPGQPIRALSCALAPEQAQAIANLTGHPVYASPFIVGVEAGAGKMPIEQFIRFDYAAGKWSMTAEKQVWNLYMPR
ncbi:MAG: RHS repeat-associated core domain-containing protein [Steroidobacteraceae bacterium]